MGGILNNVYDPGKQPKGLTELADEIPVGDNRSLIVPTILQVASEELEYWTNMTCFYDKQWEFNPKLSTVPICFFHITSVTEITSAQAPEKRVIVYETPNTKNSNSPGFSTKLGNSPAYQNNLRVIMDNVIVQPKQYQMEVIIPATLIGPYIKQGMQKLSAMVEFMGDVDLVSSGAAGVIESGMRVVQGVFDVVNSAASAADLILGAAETGSTQIATMNKNSIDAMVGSGHLVCFKKWTGYDYSYGLLTKVDIAKKPQEEGVYRGSLTFQEVPILNISQKNIVAGVSSVAAAISNAAAQTARYVNLAVALPFMKITGVVDEAGAPGSADNSKKGYLDFSNTTSLF